MRTQKKRITIKFTPKMYNLLKIRAEKESTSINEQARIIIDKVISDHTDTELGRYVRAYSHKEVEQKNLVKEIKITEVQYNKLIKMNTAISATVYRILAMELIFGYDTKSLVHHEAESTDSRFQSLSTYTIEEIVSDIPLQEEIDKYNTYLTSLEWYSLSQKKTCVIKLTVNQLKKIMTYVHFHTDVFRPTWSMGKIISFIFEAYFKKQVLNKIRYEKEMENQIIDLEDEYNPELSLNISLYIELKELLLLYPTKRKFSSESDKIGYMLCKLVKDVGAIQNG